MACIRQNCRRLAKLVSFMDHAAPESTIQTTDALLPVINHFTCRSLTIGSWRRIGQNSMDLVVFYSPEKACMTYYINNDSSGYKIEYPFSFIKSITLEPGSAQPVTGGVHSSPGPGLHVELSHPPLFYMDSSNSGGFYQCGDFTEDRQASQVLVHHLGGHPKVLGIQLSKLVSLESYQNRSTYPSVANTTTTMPPPISPAVPFIPRPASQPNRFATSPNHFPTSPFPGTFQDSLVAAMDMQQRPHVHKRQRSRSVPAAVDFSHLYPPPYSVLQAAPPSPAHFSPDVGIFAPVPQSTHSLAANLRVDTSAPFNLAYPLSAPAPRSPTNFTSPSLFTTAGTPDMGSSVGNPFNVPFVDSSDVPVSSPYAAVTPVDTSIASHSPSLVGMPGQPDMFGIGLEQHDPMADEEGMLYLKQNGSFPVSPAVGRLSFDVPIHSMPSQSPATSKTEFSSIASLDNVKPDPLSQTS